MTDRGEAIRWWLEHAEKQAAAIAADKRLPQIRDIQKDATWRQWITEAIDPDRRSRDFKIVRGLLTESTDDAFDEAEKVLRLFDANRQLLADLCAQWDATAQLRRSRLPRRQRAVWQRVVAEHLAKAVGGSKERQWKAIPKNGDGLLLRLDGKEIGVLRDGKDLICEIDGGQKKVAQSTFFRNYLKKVEMVSR